MTAWRGCSRAWAPRRRSSPAVPPARAAPVVPSFDRPAATAGERVIVSAAGFASRKPARIYLAPRAEVSKIRGPLDRRLHFVGVVNPRRGRASATFVLPPLASGRYAVWCAGCRGRATLQVTMPAASPDFCPATPPTSVAPPPGLNRAFQWHGNGRLWTFASPDGVWTGPAAARLAGRHALQQAALGGPTGVRQARRHADPARRACSGRQRRDRLRISGRLGRAVVGGAHAVLEPPAAGWCEAGWMT